MEASSGGFFGRYGEYLPSTSLVDNLKLAKRAAGHHHEVIFAVTGAVAAANMTKAALNLNVKSVILNAFILIVAVYEAYNAAIRDIINDLKRERDGLKVEVNKLGKTESNLSGRVTDFKKQLEQGEEQLKENQKQLDSFAGRVKELNDKIASLTETEKLLSENVSAMSTLNQSFANGLVFMKENNVKFDQGQEKMLSCSSTSDPDQW